MKIFPQQSPKKQKNPGIFAVLMGKTQTQRIPTPQPMLLKIKK